MRMSTPTWVAVAWTLAAVAAIGGAYANGLDSAAGSIRPSPLGVCPPFPLRDESGNPIDPVHGENDTAPYSPRQTCGASGCHDYKKITEGFHFTQGKGEPIPDTFASRYGWVTSPGNYGGTWCSPAPLYRQLAPKSNTSARMIDMTSFDFVTATCGNCHPGGGPLEYDRDGKRYDEWMRDPTSGLTPGGENNLDGDYYRARWSETGVIEADCLLCHMPEYDHKKRNEALMNLNFRWAASVGAGLGTVTGTVAAGERPVVTYDKSRFDADGNVLVHIAPEPRNETCLNCHAKPGWKKRAASFSARTDVHIRAGLRCVDCHAGGSRAVDPRIQGWEVHQFGKGDDPSGNVRNDLDNTMRTCENCHLEGWYNAPIADHDWLPSLHLQRIACQTCHIPQRAVNCAMVQASDVYNPAPRISPPPKHIWTFYDQQMRVWNHYGDLDLFTVKDQPTETWRPMFARYRGMIYPMNRVHSTWVGFEEEGKPGLNQLFMRDFFTMWKEHAAAPETAYPQLNAIMDDNGDGMPEVNSPEEIDALLGSVREHLTKTGFDLTGKRLVWVCDDLAYSDGTTWRQLPKEPWEASPYASTYKYSHDVAPAKAALGADGCTDCHDKNSDVFFAASIQYPFANKGLPTYISQAEVIETTATKARLSAWRETRLKPAVPWVLGGIVALLLLHFVTFGPRRIHENQTELELVRYTWSERVVHLLIMLCFAFLFLTGVAFLLGVNDLLGPASRYLHKIVGTVMAACVLVMAVRWARTALFCAFDRTWFAHVGGYFGTGEELPAGKFNAGQKLYFWLALACVAALAGTGAIMGWGGEPLRAWLPVAHTLHATLALTFCVIALGHLYLAVLANPGSLKAIMLGKVSRNWALYHHSKWVNELDQSSGKPE